LGDRRGGGSAILTDVHRPDRTAVQFELQQILESDDFDGSRRSREFLRFIVEEALAGRGHELTQSLIATHVFQRRDDFDAVVDPIVRIQAGRLRRSLERYYLLSGKRDPVRIELPRGGYAPDFHSVVPTEEAPPPRNAPHGPSADGWPTVLVGPLETAAGADLDDLAIRLGEELALELGHYRTARVVQRRDLELLGPPGGGQVRFAFSGRLSRDGDDLWVTARLVDRTTGEQIWGDDYPTAPQPGRWSGSPQDVARVIAARLGAEEGVVVQHLASERRRRGPVDATPYDAVMRACEFFLARNPEALGPAMEALRQVVNAEPECGPAWTWLARLCLVNYAFELTTLPTPLDEAVTFAQYGVRVDPASRSARCILASCLLIKGELAAGRSELEEALNASPRSLVYLDIIGFLLTLFGDWDRGPALARLARERNPHCLPQALFGLWADHVRRGEDEQAYQTALEYRDPTFFWRPVMRASCLGLLGRTTEARAEVAELLSRKIDFPVRGRVLLGYYLKFPEVKDRVVEGLARAGLELE
jgi:adenylate cyclase